MECYNSWLWREVTPLKSLLGSYFSFHLVSAKAFLVPCCIYRSDIHSELNQFRSTGVVALRNAFAHHASDAHPIVAVGRTPAEDSTYLQLWVLEGSGKISRIKRHEAFAEFNVKYRKARESLGKLLNMVQQRFENADTSLPK